MQQAVLFTSQKDLHTDLVLEHLLERGRVEPIRLNTEEFPIDATFTLHQDQSKQRGCIELTRAGRTIQLTRVASVWVRRPTQLAVPDPDGGQPVDESDRRFARAEAAAALEGFLMSSPAIWVNDLDAERRASNKIYQLSAARTCGLAVPRTIVTNDPADARDFARSCSGRVVYKPLTSPMNSLPPDAQGARIGPTIVLSAAQLDQLDHVAGAPTQLQEFIPKDREFRVTIVGSEVLAAEIDPHTSPGGEVDWRQAGMDLSIRRAELPRPVADALLRLMQTLGLRYAAIDLIRSTLGEYFLIDVNPSGQFAFVEELVPDLQIRDALVRLLEGGCP